MVSENTNILKIIEVFQNHIHPDDFDYFYNNIMSIISSGISTTLKLACRIKLNPTSEYNLLLGSLLLINLNDTKTTNYNVKFSGFHFENEFYNEIKNKDIFIKYLKSLNILQFLLTNDKNENIKYIIRFLKDIFDFDSIIYVNSKNCKENDIIYLDEWVENLYKYDLNVFISEYTSR